MEKEFEYKLYWIDGAFKENINPLLIMNDISFSSTINWGQWELNLDFKADFSDTTFTISDVIEIYIYTDNYPNGLLLYSGVLSSITRNLVWGKIFLKLSFLWLSSLLSFIYYNQSWYTFSENQDPAQTIKDIIDYFNTIYTWAWLSYSGGNISNYWTAINLDFDYTKCIDAIKKIREVTDFWWYIWADWQVYFKEKSATITHYFKVEKDVEEIVLEEDGEKIVNRHILKWKSGTLAATNDVTSQNTYWLRELKEDKTNIADSWSATEYTTNYIAEFKDLLQKTRITINNNYNIESIKPWDVIKIQNLDYTITNLQIKKINYSKNSLKIELEDYNNLWKEIFNT